MNGDKKDDLHTSAPCLIRKVYILRHDRLLMTSQIHCATQQFVMRVQQVIPSSLDLNSIRGHIHDRPCDYVYTYIHRDIKRNRYDFGVLTVIGKIWTRELYATPIIYHIKGLRGFHGVSSLA